jgi:hypothetical protein
MRKPKGHYISLRDAHQEIGWLNAMSDAEHLNTRLIRQNSESVYRVPSARQPLKVGPAALNNPFRACCFHLMARLVCDPTLIHCCCSIG